MVEVKENQRNWKGFLSDYDAIIDDPIDTSSCCYCLTEPQVQALLGMCEQLHWPTRWNSRIGTPIDRDIVDAFASEIERRLMDSCCGHDTTVIEHRVNPETDALEISTDGGETWVQDPEDPRITVTQLPPVVPPEGVTAKCQAAHNMMVQAVTFKGVLSVGLLDALTLAALVAALVAIIGVLIFNPTKAFMLIPVIINTAAAFIGMSQSTYDDAFTDADFHLLECIFFCHLDDEGHVEDLALIKGDINTKFAGNDIARRTFLMYVAALGELGLNVVGATTIEVVTDPGCDDCDCGECVISNWQPETGFGVIVDSDDTSVTLDSQLSSGSHRVIISTHPGFTGSETHDSPCCVIESIDLIAGSPTSLVSIGVECGTSYASTLPGLITGKCVWAIELDYDSPVTVKVTFGASCSPPP